LLFYEIGYNLRTPLYKLKEEMPYDELLGWMSYFEERPVGWRDDDRTFKLIQVVSAIAGGGSNRKPWDMFPTLYPLYNSDRKREGTDMSTLKQSAMFQKILSAKGGVKLDVD